ncbi:MAG: hypothetical protein ABIG55_03960 [Candidatus Omnitrophota bacterium]
MNKIVILIVIAMFLAAGEAYPRTQIMKGVEVYTFKKDRVDQELEGNRGYLTGKPSSIPSKKRTDERVLIGVDVELPSSFFGEGKDSGEEEEAEESYGKADETAAPVITRTTDGSAEKKEIKSSVSKEPYGQTAVTVEIKERAGEIEEEEWIK